MIKLIITERPEKLSLNIDGITIITPSEYFEKEEYQQNKDLKVINLCKSLQYQSIGYYVSLLAEARRHKIIPKLNTLQDFRFSSIIKSDTQDFDDLIQQILLPKSENKVIIDICFGAVEDLAYTRIGLLLFNLFQMPMMQASFVKKDKWQLQSLKPFYFDEIPAEKKKFLEESLQQYLSGKKIVRSNYNRKKYDLAILVNPEDNNSPSNPRALQKFVAAAGKIGFNTEFITRNDFAKLVQFDALFIRETTNVNHYTYRFAKKAESEGLVVIDDPDSILRCTNKVFLNELLNSNKIPVPKSVILRKDSASIPDSLGYPIVVKQPDGSFSKGVKKVESKEKLGEHLSKLFKKSELLIAQEFIPTSYDWRVGVIDNKPLYVCQYFMAHNHWQIVDWDKNGKHREGKSETIAVEDAPKGLLKTALKATELIGNGLYGVDIKEIDGKFYVIEVNDNPNIDAGVEDKVIKAQLYTRVMEVFLNRLKNR